MKQAAEITAIGGESPTNGAANQIEFTEPYTVMIQLTGSADLIFHRWNVEAVEEKAAAKKGSKAKKTDDLESYVYRDEKGSICLPGEYLRQSVIHAAKFHQDPRSPRKSAMDLFKAGLVVLTQLATLGSKKWEYEDRRRVTVQRNGITRARPAFLKGWKAEIEFAVLLPEYISPTFLHDVLNTAGRLIGVGDFRPTFGRFQITKYQTK
jgi:hypothetical protein